MAATAAPTNEGAANSLDASVSTHGIAVLVLGVAFLSQIGTLFIRIAQGNFSIAFLTAPFLAMALLDQSTKLEDAKMAVARRKGEETTIYSPYLVVAMVALLVAMLLFAIVTAA